MLATDYGSLGGFFMSKGVGMDILQGKHKEWKKVNKERLLVRDLMVQEERKKPYAYKVAISIGLATIIFIGGCIAGRKAFADQIDLKKIAQIESSGCKYKNGDSGSSIGCYQVKDALVEWNQFHPKQQFSKRQMLDDDLCFKVADWYLNKRIPQMLRAFKKPVTTRNILISYNAGISYVVKNKSLPKITIAYLKKYGA